ETQGPIADRTNERLTSSDRGVILLREVMFRELKKVRQGQDPMGIVRDAANNPFIDTHLLESIAQIGDDRAPRAVNQSAPTELLDPSPRGSVVLLRVQSLLLGFSQRTPSSIAIIRPVSRAPDQTLSLPWHLTEAKIQSLRRRSNSRIAENNFYG